MLTPTHPQSTEAKFRALYLGSDLEFTTALQRVLTESEYRLVSCSDSGSAVLFLESEIPYQFLLIDFDWRGKESFKLAQLANSLSHRKRMPIILVATAELSRDIKTSALEAGVKKIVTKSVDMAAISNAIRQSGLR